MTISRMKGMNPDWKRTFFSMHADRIHIAWHGKKGGVAGLLA
jgi:hypothetical protein